MTNPYEIPLKKLHKEKIYVGEKICNNEVVGLWIGYDSPITHDKMLERIKDIVGENFNVWYLGNNTMEFHIELKK